MQLCCVQRVFARPLRVRLLCLLRFRAPVARHAPPTTLPAPPSPGSRHPIPPPALPALAGLQEDRFLTLLEGAGFALQDVPACQLAQEYREGGYRVVRACRID